MELSTKNHQLNAEDKFASIIRYVPVGIAEIAYNGEIIHLNEKGEKLFKTILTGVGIDSNNFYDILKVIAPSIVKSIDSYKGESGRILTNELQTFTYSSDSEATEKHFVFTVIKISADCIIIHFDDVTEKRFKEKMAQQVLSDRTIMQGRFEITANVLHDIGNALVGFGSYLNKIKRSIESDNPSHLANLLDFFSGQQDALAAVMGKDKAGAVIKIISGIAQTQKTNQQDIGISIKEQQHIISHIQEILNIHRQYISGNDVQERKSVSVPEIIRDCLSMLLASFSKRGITVAVDIPENLPVIKGDRTRLMQVVLNILKNSIEAIEVYAIEKNIYLSVKVCDDLMIIHVKDSGSGFDDTTAKMLFKRGFTTKSTGSGLGLNGCKAIIESHEGTMEIASDGVGKGALTTIKLKISNS